MGTRMMRIRRSKSQSLPVSSTSVFIPSVTGLDLKKTGLRKFFARLNAWILMSNFIVKWKLRTDRGWDKQNKNNFYFLMFIFLHFMDG